MSHGEGSAHDTLRWGDSETIEIGTKLNNEFGTQLTTKQLVAAHWRWPLVWKMQVIIGTAIATGTANFTAHLEIIIGVGQSQMRFVKDYTIVPNGSGVFPLFILDSLDLPAQDIQSRVTIEQTAGVAVAGDSVSFGLFVAPVTEPHAQTAILDELARGQAPESVQWMDGQPFHEQPLHYRGPAYGR